MAVVFEEVVRGVVTAKKEGIRRERERERHRERGQKKERETKREEIGEQSKKSIAR